MTDNALKAAVAQFLTEDGYSFDERDLAPDSYYSNRMARSISAYLSALPEEAEVVAWNVAFPGLPTEPTNNAGFASEVLSPGGSAVPLVTLASFQAMQARVKDAVGLLDHLIGWIVHDCGAEPPFTSEQDETYAAIKGSHHDR